MFENSVLLFFFFFFFLLMFYQIFFDKTFHKILQKFYARQKNIWKNRGYWEIISYCFPETYPSRCKFVPVDGLYIKMSISRWMETFCSNEVSSLWLWLTRRLVTIDRKISSLIFQVTTFIYTEARDMEFSHLHSFRGS